MLDSHNHRITVHIMKPWIVCVSAGLLLSCSLTGAQTPINSKVLAPYKWEGKSRDVVQDRLVLYYFGASDCAPCNTPQNIELLKPTTVAA